MDRIEVAVDVCNGKPVIKGTRITVGTILGYLSSGDSIEDILKAYPSLTQDDVLACFDYARRVSDAHTTVWAG